MVQILYEACLWGGGVLLGYVISTHVYQRKFRRMRSQLESWREEDRLMFRRLRFKLRLTEPVDRDVSVPSVRGPRHRV